MAEAMGKLRRKEAAKRADFQRGVEQLLPEALLTALGLMGEAPHCQISLPTAPSSLPLITAEDLRRGPLAPDASSRVSQTLSYRVYGSCLSQIGCTSPGRLTACTCRGQAE